MHSIQEKDWGLKKVLFQSDTAQLDLLSIRKGGFSSKHKHHHKYNYFYILKGKLQLNLYKSNNLAKPFIEILLSHQPDTRIEYIVQPGIHHEFKALEDTECIEYSFVKISEDIYRLNEGGCET